MTLTNWQPLRRVLRDMSRWQGEMDRLFANGSPVFAAAFPALNLWEDEDSLYAEAELPGVDMAGLEIVVTNGNQLSLKGERKQPEVEQGVWHRQECGTGAFVRSLTLPAMVDADKIEAKLAQGVLTITMPKSAAARPKKITVKAE